jgi:histone H3/H4
MSDVGGDVATITTRLGSDLSREAAKMTNEAIKHLLLFLIQKAKEQSDKAGEMALS